MKRVRLWWTVLAVVLVGFAIFESVKYGWVAGGVVLCWILAPDITLVGAFDVSRKGFLRSSRVRAYNIAHTPWWPLAVMAIAIIAPLPPLGFGLRGGLELFLVGLSWLAHIAVDRAFGYGLRAADGSVRPVGSSQTMRRTPCSA